MQRFFEGYTGCDTTILQTAKEGYKLKEGGYALMYDMHPFNRSF